MAGVAFNHQEGSFMPELRRARRTAAAALLALFALPIRLHAGSDALHPGEYITEDGWGVLTVSASGNRTTFSLEAVGANGHTCSLEGEVRNLRAQLEAAEPDKPCVVTFQPKAGGIDVASVDSETCRYYCGMRAWFEGEYLEPSPGCTAKERGATREQFKKLYDAKSYAKASGVLAPLLRDCSRTLDWLETGEIRNDLAITQYHLGQLEECRKTLGPLAEDAAKKDEELQEAYPPSDFDSYQPILRATRHNLKLCAKKGK
jgi:hypothetical protein